MGNRYSGKYIVIDTTDTQIGGPNPAGGPKGDLHIIAIKWCGTGNSGRDIAQNDTLSVEWGKEGGDEVIAVKAQANPPHQLAYSVDFPKAWIVPGLYIEDIDGGELVLYLE